ncbi:MAG: amidohydrolase [Fretibacterium sp.]|nr:amidohydrolase [Fretibacterium sp.]
MNKDNLKKITELRHELHAHPELSGSEGWTKRRLMDFIEDNTTLAVVDCGSWFYAAHYAEGTEAIAFRADMDALPITEAGAAAGLPWVSRQPGVSHKCGHDGHSAALCGVGLELENVPHPRSVYLIFQHAEETGCGGQICSALLRERPVSEIYAFHNRSGYPVGSVIVRSGLCQCASKGLTVKMTGRRSHASEPEKGINPSFALASLVSHVERLLNEPHRGLVLCTVVNIAAGQKDFGISAGEGEVSMTLRADREAEMDALEADIRQEAARLARKAGLEVGFEVSDPFPETVSSAECVRRAEAAAKRLGFPLLQMEAPWRASEDFGYYTREVPGAIFYIGSGEDYPPLHTPEYDFNDAILETAVDMFLAIYQEEGAF